ncbi:MAG: hypothetical protein K2X52_13195 [Mycobacteriaceae bacterium]|nr:hypothetical protein [Mycobacteriaceae bacterium]
MLAGTVRPAGPADESNILERFACGGVRVLRRGAWRDRVVRPDLYDPQINLTYGELAAFYGTLVDEPVTIFV